MNNGRLKIFVVDERNIPVKECVVDLSVTGGDLEFKRSAVTDENGIVWFEDLPVPPKELSLQEDNVEQPYNEYTAVARGMELLDVSGIQLFDDTNGILKMILRGGSTGENLVIPPHVIYGEYPSKIPEAETKPLEETGQIVLSRVVVPEYVVVHDGAPSDNTAKDYYVTYKEYIKNVASCEIYPTWPEAALRANILAIMSFTMNRVYTEWYRNKGYDFTVTSSTAYDQKFVYGRNIYDSISKIVDEIFANYLSRPGLKQPLLTQYCDGKKVTCSNWMTQWGSKRLADQGKNTIQILRYFYGDSIYINTADGISGIPSSWPGGNLQVGSSGSKVKQMQEQLDEIAKVYSSIPRVQADGIYGAGTEKSVREFQKVFDLPVTGVVDYKTWYKISQIYVGITRIAELS